VTLRSLSKKKRLHRAWRLFHTYSAYARGIDMMSADYQALDLTPKGRDEGERDWWTESQSGSHRNPLCVMVDLSTGRLTKPF
jgi:hypothetical protein